MATLIDLIRHGEPVGGSRYRGQQDDPLSEKGWGQMRAAVGAHCPWSHIVSSPLQRCAAFAQELADRHGLPLHIEPRLREIGFGVWEGKTRAELEAAEPGCLQRFYADPVQCTPPGAEPLPEFSARVASALDELVARHPNQHLLIVGHAGVIRAAVGHVLGTPVGNLFRLQVENACLTRLRFSTDSPTLLFHGGAL